MSLCESFKLPSQRDEPQIDREQKKKIYLQRVWPISANAESIEAFRHLRKEANLHPLIDVKSSNVVQITERLEGRHRFRLADNLLTEPIIGLDTKDGCSKVLVVSYHHIRLIKLNLRPNRKAINPEVLGQSHVRVRRVVRVVDA